MVEADVVSDSQPGFDKSFEPVEFLWGERREGKPDLGRGQLARNVKRVLDRNRIGIHLEEIVEILPGLEVKKMNK